MVAATSALGGSRLARRGKSGGRRRREGEVRRRTVPQPVVATSIPRVHLRRREHLMPVDAARRQRGRNRRRTHRLVLRSRCRRLADQTSSHRNIISHYLVPYSCATLTFCLQTTSLAAGILSLSINRRRAFFYIRKAPHASSRLTRNG